MLRFKACLILCISDMLSSMPEYWSGRASNLNMGLINKVDMVCLSPVGYGV